MDHSYILKFSQIQIVVNFVYLISIVFFIFGIKNLSSAKTARKGNLYSAFAMLLAVAAALFERKILNPEWILIGIALGGGIGLIFAYKVKMTQMPEMVAIFNGFGGGASALVASAEFFKLFDQSLPSFGIYLGITIPLSILIGTITFTGSFIAFGKLQGFIPSKPITYPGQNIINSLLFIGLIYFLVMLIISDGNAVNLYLIIGISALLGITMVIPIGGADMPVVISLLNSYSGLAAAATGFVLNNYVFILAGALVGASGIILTNLMCVAMNRSLANVLFSAFGKVNPASDKTGEKRTVKSYSVEDAIIQFESAGSVVIVPGYGLAVAQAQHSIKELADILEKRGVDVKYGIHPVAGRMPGHMNVLLAEANIDYDKLKELEKINPEMESTDVVITVGANDVINPVAREDKSSPIYGMPIIDCDKAKTCMIIKRSLSPGLIMISFIEKGQ